LEDPYARFHLWTRMYSQLFDHFIDVLLLSAATESEAGFIYELPFARISCVILLLITGSNDSGRYE